MELVTLNRNTLLPERVVEVEASLVWAERYSNEGDFLLKAHDISKAMSLLPEDTYVGLGGSNVPMIVETHKLRKPLNDAPYVEITGRTLETLLERRVSVKGPIPEALPLDRKPWEIPAGRASDAAYRAIREVIGDTTARGTGLPAVPYSSLVSPNDAFRNPDGSQLFDLPRPTDFVNTPNEWVDSQTYGIGAVVHHANYIWKALTSNTASPPADNPTHWEKTGDWYPFEVAGGQLYTKVMEMITSSRRGLRVSRPSRGGPPRFTMEIYNGVDRTEQYSVDVAFDQFDDATYLLTKVGSANMAYVYGSEGSSIVPKNNFSVQPSGLCRRVLYVDESGNAEVNSPETMRSRGIFDLYKHNATALFEGETSVQIASDYNRGYFLGDIISLVGDYGLTSKVRVVEFIRSIDTSGYKAYPTFEEIDIYATD